MQISKKRFLFFIFILIFTSFLSLKGSIGEYSRSIQTLTVLSMAMYCVFNYNSVFHSSKLFLKRYVLIFMVLPWLSIIPAYFSHGQKFIYSALVLIPINGVFLLYFIFTKMKLTEKDVIKTLIVFSVIYTFIELFQQITYPVYWFAGRNESESTGTLEVRLGMYKFYMTGIHLLFIPLFYSWEKILEKATHKNLLVFIVLTIGLYAFLARKFVFAFIITILTSFFLRRKINKLLVIGTFLIGILLYFNQEAIFGNYLETTQSELGNEDFIRYQSRLYFTSYFNDNLCLILGNGRDHQSSGYGAFIQYLAESFGFYRSDIGIFAHFSYYGLVGMLSVLYFGFYLVKRWKYLPLYIKLYFVFTLIQLTVAFPLNSSIGIFTFVVVLYLMEINFRENRLVLKKNK